MEMEKKPLLELKSIRKQFGSVAANDNVNLKIYPGEVHALLGENGAGKSTLMNILYGMYQPDTGIIEKNGKAIQIRSPRDAMRNGIGMVHQHYMLVDVYTSAENVFLMGDDPWWKRKNDKEIERELDKLGKQYGLEVDATVPIHTLSVGMQQRVEILKLLYTGADVLILDEPTAVLLPQECDTLFETIDSLVAHGKSIIFISHKLEEVLRVSQRITVMSQGHVEGQMMTADANKEKIVRMMIGKDISPPDMHRKTVGDDERREILRVEDLAAKDGRGVDTLNGVSLTLRSSEVLGIASLEGNGQTELAEVLAGVRRPTRGSVVINGKTASTANAHDFILNDICYVPADRNEVGTVKDFPLYENWILRRKHLPKKHGLIDYRTVADETAEAMVEYDVRAPGIKTRSANLSGGNLQKFILAREMHKGPRVLICSYPTRGLDIKASWFIREQLLASRDAGLGVMLISGEMEELFGLSDRIIVLYRGKVVGEVNPRDVSIYDVGRMMMGVTS